jgi:hypothetical protein
VKSSILTLTKVPLDLRSMTIKNSFFLKREARIEKLHRTRNCVKVMFCIQLIVGTIVNQGKSGRKYQ